MVRSVLELCVDTNDVSGTVVVCLALVVSVDAGTVVARVVVGWPVLVLPDDPDDSALLVLCPALVVCVDTDVTGLLVV